MKKKKKKNKFYCDQLRGLWELGGEVVILRVRVSWLCLWRQCRPPPQLQLLLAVSGRLSSPTVSSCARIIEPQCEDMYDGVILLPMRMIGHLYRDITLARFVAL